MLRRSFLSLILISIVLSEIASPLFLYAQTADELQGNLTSLSTQIAALDKEIQEYNTKIAGTQGQAKSLKQALAQLETRRASLALDINRTKLQISQAQIQISATQNKIVITQSTLEKNKNALSEVLRSMVTDAQTIPPLVGVLAAGSHLSDALDIIKRGGDASRALHEKVTALANTQSTLTDQKATYESHKKTLVALHDMLADQKTLVDQTTQDKNALLVETKNKETEYQKLLADRQVKKGALEAEMLDVESKLKVTVDTSTLPKTGRGVLQYPVDNVIITQYFGNTPFASQNPQVYNGAGHNGVDFGTKVGTPIYAAANGTVVGVGNTDTGCSGVSYGKWVLIRHNNGLTTLYAHLSVQQVTVGQVVTVHQKIGLSGNTGYTTGPHLHFTVYASDSVHVSGPTEYKSKVCGTYMVLPLAPRAGYLNPLSYL
jgi:murein DD-endopeptidase MepM/ murein hydrolase activator NlpD